MIITATSKTNNKRQLVAAGGRKEEDNGEKQIHSSVGRRLDGRRSNDDGDEHI